MIADREIDGLTGFGPALAARPGAAAARLAPLAGPQFAALFGTRKEGLFGPAAAERLKKAQGPARGKAPFSGGLARRAEPAARPSGFMGAATAARLPAFRKKTRADDAGGKGAPG